MSDIEEYHNTDNIDRTITFLPTNIFNRELTVRQELM